MAMVRPVGRLKIQVVAPPEPFGVGRMTTSSSLRTSRSVSRSTWRAVANGSSMSRLIVRLPVSIRLIVEALRLVSAASSSSDKPSVVRRLRSRVRTTCSMLLSSTMVPVPFLRISQRHVQFPE